MEDLRKESRESLIRGTNNKKNLCETLRFIYDKVEEIDYYYPEAEVVVMIELLVDTMVMAKKMQDRLSYYQKTYKDNTGNKAKDIVGLTGVRARSIMRKKRKI